MTTAEDMREILLDFKPYFVKHKDKNPKILRYAFLLQAVSMSGKRTTKETKKLMDKIINLLEFE